MVSDFGLTFASGVGHGAAWAGATSRIAEKAKTPRHARKAGRLLDFMVNPLCGAFPCAGPVMLVSTRDAVITHLV
jgi:hypothetical protein